MCEALTFLLDNIYRRIFIKLFRQIVGIPMGYAPLVANLFLFCYERDFIMSLSKEKQSEVIEVCSSTSRYDLLNIDNKYCDSLIRQICHSDLQMDKAHSSETEAPLLDLHLPILDWFISRKIHDKPDDFDFEVVNISYLDGNVPRRASYGVYISQLIRFARVSSRATDFNTRNKLLTAKLINPGYRYHKLNKAFSKFKDISI